MTALLTSAVVNHSRACAVTGFIGGGVVAFSGARFPVVLTVGVPVIFFAALLSGLMIARGRDVIARHLRRYAFGAVASFAGYVFAVVVFSAATGYAQDFVGASSDILDFGPDVVIGLLAAGCVSAVEVALLVAFVGGRWSGQLVGLLAAAGVLAIAAALATNAIAHAYWSSVGVLFVIGMTLFCWLAGSEIVRCYHPPP